MARHPSERTVIFLIGAVQFVNILDFMMVLPLGPFFAGPLGIPASRIGVIGGSYTAAAAISGIACSFFLDRFDRRKALGVAVAGLVMATALGGFSVGFGSIVFARILAGFFGGPATSLSLSIVADVIPAERRGKALGAVMGSFSVAAVLGGYAAVGALVRSDSRRAALRVSLALAVIATLTALTARRNVDYGSEVSIWSDATEKRPWNPRAHNNLGNALLRAGDLDGAFAQYAEAIRLEPDYAEAHYNLGNAFLRKGRPTDAAASYAAALRIDPELAGDGAEHI